MSKLALANIFDKFKAGIVDTFMIAMPIQYFITYMIAGGAKNYREDQTLIFIATAIYCLIILLFLFFKTQTPGYKYFNLHLRNKNGKRASFAQVVLRMIVYIVSFALLFGIIFPFLRKDQQFLHDLLSETLVLKEIK